MEFSLYIYLVLYLVTLIAISLYIAKKEDKEGFLIANRDRKWWSISLSKFAAAIGVNYFVAYTGYAYDYGLGVYLVLLGTIFGYLWFGFWAAPKIRAYSSKNSFYTQGDFVGFAIGSDFAKKLVNWIANSIMFAWLMIGIVGGAKIINYFGLLSYEMALLTTVLFVLSYILISGFRAVLATDILQSAIIIALMFLLTWIIVGNIGISDILLAQTGSVDIGTSVGFLIFGALAVFSYPNFYQLIYSAKNKRTASMGIIYSIIPTILIATLLLMIGMFMYLQNPNLDSGLVFLEAFKYYLPKSILPFGIVLFFAGLMSNADTSIYTIASHYVLSKNDTSKHSVRKIRVVSIVLSVITIVIGYFFRDIVDITVIAAGMSLTLSMAMIYLIAGGKNKYRFIGSVFGGVLGLLLGILIVGVKPAAALVVIVVGSVGLLYNGWFIKDKKTTI